jgi:hypothetical protein
MHKVNSLGAWRKPHQERGEKLSELEMLGYRLGLPEGFVCSQYEGLVWTEYASAIERKETDVERKTIHLFSERVKQIAELLNDAPKSVTGDLAYWDGSADLVARWSVKDMISGNEVGVAVKIVGSQDCKLIDDPKDTRELKPEMVTPRRRRILHPECASMLKELEG